MATFPTNLLQPLAGTIEGPPWDVSITIPLEPFRLRGEMFDTKVSLDFIQLPSAEPLRLAGGDFRFPLNPTDGYIDGSVYIDGAHHPVDVTRIRFGQTNTRSISATLSTQLRLEFETLFDFRNTIWTIDTMLDFVPPRDEERIRAVRASRKLAERKKKAKKR